MARDDLSFAEDDWSFAKDSLSSREDNRSFAKDGASFGLVFSTNSGDKPVSDFAPEGYGRQNSSKNREGVPSKRTPSLIFSWPNPVERPGNRTNRPSERR